MSLLMEIKESIDASEKRIDELTQNDKFDEAREEAGKVAAFREMYQKEAARIEEENKRLAEEIAKSVNPDKLVSFGEKVLGPQNQFIEAQFGKVKIENAGDSTTTFTGTVLPTPTTMDTNLPGVLAQPNGFYDTLPKFTTEGDEKYFLPPTFKNNAETHTLGSEKAMSELTWTEHTSQIETIAHYMPVHNQMKNRYQTLVSTINSALMLGLRLKRGSKCLRGANNNGIIGAVNFPGIQTWTYKSTDNLVDNIADMAMMSTLGSGIAPNYVALSPKTIRAIAKLKDKNDRYLFPDFKAGDTLPGTNMTVVEDVNMTVTTVTKGEDNKDVVTVKETALVYYNGVASYKAADNDAVTAGFIDKQFVENSFTLLGEGTGLLRIDTPASFVYCDDLGL